VTSIATAERQIISKVQSDKFHRFPNYSNVLIDSSHRQYPQHVNAALLKLRKSATKEECDNMGVQLGPDEGENKGLKMRRKMDKRRTKFTKTSRYKR